MAELSLLFEHHSWEVHAYVEDPQKYDLCPSGDADLLQMHLSTCLGEVALWMRSHKLQLNTD
jgi:hypothetical protein